MPGYICHTYTVPQQEVHMVFGFWISPSPRDVGRLPSTPENSWTTFPLSSFSFNGCFTTDCLHLVDYVDCMDYVDTLSCCYFKKSIDIRRL